MPTMEVTTPIASFALSSALALLDMRLEIADVPPAFGPGARPAGKPGLAQGFPHGFAAGAVARGVDLVLGDAADIGPAAEELAEMAFLVAPCRDLDGAADARVGIDDAGGFQRIDDAERPIEPARVILAFEMRARQQFGPGFRAGAEHIADAVDLGGESGLGQAARASHCSERIWASEKVGL